MAVTSRDRWPLCMRSRCTLYQQIPDRRTESPSPITLRSGATSAPLLSRLTLRPLRALSSCPADIEGRSDPNCCPSYTDGPVPRAGVEATKSKIDPSSCERERDLVDGGDRRSGQSGGGGGGGKRSEGAAGLARSVERGARRGVRERER